MTAARLDRPILVAQARTKEFNEISRRAGEAGEIRVKKDIRSLILSDLQALSPSPFFGDAEDRIGEVVDLAHQWNVIVRSMYVDHLYQPFFPKIGTIFNPATSTTYYKYKSDVSSACVQAVVGMGVEISDIKARPGSVEYLVQQQGKACVLLDVPPLVAYSN